MTGNMDESEDEKKRSSIMGVLRPLVLLFVCATLGGLIAFQQRHQAEWATTKYDEQFPLPSPGAWRESDSLVPSENLRSIPPWRLRVHDGIRSSLGRGASAGERAKLCRTPSLNVQVDSPYKSESAMGRIKRSYVCLRTRGCRGQAMQELWNRRYMKKYNMLTATFLMTDTTAINRLKRDDKEGFEDIMVTHEGEYYISALDGGDAISGNKAKQLEVKRSYAERFGCDYNSLLIQPAQFTMHRKKECKAFFNFAQEFKDQMWIRKPILGQGGVGITLHDNIHDFKNLSRCDSGKEDYQKVILQSYIRRPLLIHGKKFDIRVYMFIASAMPYFVFYHPGYLRRAVTEYKADSLEKNIFLTNTHFQSLETTFKLEEHIWGFARLQKYLSDHNVAGSNYVSTVLNSAIKKVLLFNFMSARDELVRRKGSYHLFGLDFMIDDELRVHFIEANGYPGFTWSRDFDTRVMVTEMFDMLLELHEAPTAFEKMTAGDMYGGFELIYSELEDGCDEKLYDPCVEFAHHNRVKMKEMAAKIGSIHDYGRRTAFKAKKQVKSDAKKGEAVCKKNSVAVDTSECAALMKQDRREKFRPLYEETRDWNMINVFVEGD